MIFAKFLILEAIIIGAWSRPRPELTHSIDELLTCGNSPLDRNDGEPFHLVVHAKKPSATGNNSGGKGASGETSGINQQRYNTRQQTRLHEEHSEENTDNEENADNEENQVATDTDTRETEDGKECYFKHVRLNPDGLEKKPRPAHSKVSTVCDGPLQSFEELANMEVEVALFGAQNYADLALIRGAAEYDNDFDDEAVKARMKNIFICKHHEDELVHSWKSWRAPRHELEKRTNKGRKKACTVPNNPLKMHGASSRKVLAKSGRLLQKEKAETVLRHTGIHLHVGIPMCQAHAETIDKLYTMLTLGKDGIQLVPKVEYVGTASLEDSRSVSRQVDLSVYCSPRSSGSRRSSLFDASESRLSNVNEASGSRRSSIYQPPQSYRTIEEESNQESNPDVTEGMKTTLQAFLKEIGVEKVFARKPFHELAIDTKRKKGDSCRWIRRKIYKMVAPGQENELEALDCKQDDNEVWLARGSEKLTAILEAVKEEYFKYSEWSDRKTLLALVAPILSFSEIQNLIPGLTHKRYTQIRNHARGMSSTESRVSESGRTKYSTMKIEEFVHFITSDHVMIGLPYGTITAKTSAGEKFEIASTLRRHRNEHIVQMYYKYLEDAYGNVGGFDIGRSSMLRILDACSAHRRKAIVGLDEFIANGRDGFDYIYKMLDKMLEEGKEDRDFVEIAKKRLKESHQYLETDFKLHVKPISRVADHCIQYALSDPVNNNFAKKCEIARYKDSHEHDILCDRCEQLKTILGEVRTHVLNYDIQPEDEKNRFVAKYSAAEKAIYDMRRHQLRSVLSSNTRKNIIEKLGDPSEADALVTLDWAMKWLPTKGREKQKDFFAKKGISWHITHVLYRNSTKHMKQRTLVHITDDEKQNSEAVLGILRHVLEDLKKHGLTKVILRSDNAGCYHSSLVLASIKNISADTGVLIERYAFSEAQAGKSSCDRMAAVIKRELRAYLDSNHDVTEPTHFINAIDSALKVNGMKFYVFELEEDEETKKEREKKKKGKGAKKNQPSIPNISALNDFTFEGNGIQAHKYSGIGPGEAIEARYWYGKESKSRIRILAEDSRPRETESDDWSPLSCTRHIVSRTDGQGDANGAEPTCEEDENEVDISDENPSTESSDIIGEAEILKREVKEEYYDCPEPGCIAQFSKRGHLVRHIIVGKHKFAIERQTMRDFALHQFQINIAGESDNRVELHEPVEQILHDIQVIKDQYTEELERGWAMKQRKEFRRHTPRQIEFLEEEFQKGVNDRSKKVNAKDSAVRMEQKKDPATNRYFYSADELLTDTQIASYFTLKARRIREQNPACFESPTMAVCSEYSGEQESSEGADDIANAEDPMVYSVEDEMIELIDKEGLIEHSEEAASGRSASSSGTKSNKSRHKRRHTRRHGRKN